MASLNISTDHGITRSDPVPHRLWIVRAALQQYVQRVDCPGVGIVRAYHRRVCDDGGTAMPAMCAPGGDQDE